MSMTLVREVFIPKGEAQLFEVDRGHVMRLVQVQGGGQVADVLPFNRENLGEHLWGSKTATDFGLHPTVGTELLSVGPWERPLMTIIGDSLPREPSPSGCYFHDLLGCCSRKTFARRSGADQDRLGCFDLISRALAPLGVPPYVVHDCYNSFMRTGIAEQRRFHEPSDAHEGDFVELRAEMNLLVAISACPGSSSQPYATGLRVEVHR